MPTIGEEVLVRALVAMPGHDEGQVRAGVWTARAATLAATGRLVVVHADNPAEEPSAVPAPPSTQAAGAGPITAGEPGAPAGLPVDPNGQAAELDVADAVAEARPAGSRRTRGR